MTLNQIITRLRTIALSHRQVRRFKTGLTADLFADHTAKYPACCLQYTTGRISVGFVTFVFRLHVVDLVHVSQDTKDNEDDVLSDTISIIMDIVAQINAGNYNDWKIGFSQNFTAEKEEDGDMFAGWFIDFEISTPYTQDICAIPSDLVIVTPNEEDMKLVYDVKYIADGTEGSTLTTGGSTPHIAEVNGKKILLITREFTPLYKVNINPVQTEYIWDNTNITLGMSTVAGERFLILYRTY
jgi:hypothetical protein